MKQKSECKYLQISQQWSVRNHNTQVSMQTLDSIPKFWLIITLDYRDQGNVWMSHLKLLLIWGENLQVNACNTALHQFQWLSDKANSVIVGCSNMKRPLMWNA